MRQFSNINSLISQVLNNTNHGIFHESVVNVLRQSSLSYKTAKKRKMNIFIFVSGNTSDLHIYIASGYQWGI